MKKLKTKEKTKFYFSKSLSLQEAIKILMKKYNKIALPHIVEKKQGTPIPFNIGMLPLRRFTVAVYTKDTNRVSGLLKQVYYRIGIAVCKVGDIYSKKEGMKQALINLQESPYMQGTTSPMVLKSLVSVIMLRANLTPQTIMDQAFGGVHASVKKPNVNKKTLKMKRELKEILSKNPSNLVFTLKKDCFKAPCHISPVEDIIQAGAIVLKKSKKSK